MNQKKKVTFSLKMRGKVGKSESNAFRDINLQCNEIQVATIQSNQWYHWGFSSALSLYCEGPVCIYGQRFQANWAPADWAPANWAPRQFGGKFNQEVYELPILVVVICEQPHVANLNLLENAQILWKIYFVLFFLECLKYGTMNISNVP